MDPEEFCIFHYIDNGDQAFPEEIIDTMGYMENEKVGEWHAELEQYI